jgi:6-hydroxycyclohex-1-ene-1-carbonyl-CoA dehydrogenase
MGGGDTAVEIAAWTVVRPSEPLVLEHRRESPGAGEVIVAVAGCGVCHTDLGFYYEGVPTRHPFPLTLGHEVSGVVVEAGPGAEAWLDRPVVVPAVLPCGDCPACRAGRGAVCPRQIFPGNDVHGGFASHLRVPARGLCPVPDLSDPDRNPERLDLAALAVIADAVSTPYQAIHRSGLGAGDLAVVVGCGGVGGFAVQIAAAFDAAVVAVDVDPERLEAMRRHGASLALDARENDFKSLKKQVRAFASERGIPEFRWFLFEASGTAAGQTTAFGLLGSGSYLSIVGFTPQRVELRLSNLMAFDATVQGNWACLPEHYPAVLDLVLAGRVAVAPFVERRPLADINETFSQLHAGPLPRRVILIPEA